MVSQILAAVIFVAMFVMIVWEKIPRHITTTIAAVLMIGIVFLGCMHSPQPYGKRLILMFSSLRVFGTQQEHLKPQE